MKEKANFLFCAVNNMTAEISEYNRDGILAPLAIVEECIISQ